MKHLEHQKRSLAKSVTYRIVIIIATFVVVLIMTGDIEKTRDVTIITSIVNTVLYYFHERAWNQIHWGKHKGK